MTTPSQTQVRLISRDRRGLMGRWAVRITVSALCSISLATVAGCGSADSAVVLDGNAGGSTSQSATQSGHEANDAADSASESSQPEDGTDSDTAANASDSSMDNMHGGSGQPSSSASPDASASPSASSSSMDMDGDCCHH